MLTSMERAVEIQQDDASDDEADAEHHDGRDGLSVEQRADGDHRSGADARPNGVRDADGDGAKRLGERVEGQGVTDHDGQ